MDYYFDFSLSDYQVLEDKNSEITLTYNLKNLLESDFLVQPVIDVGTVSLLNEQTQQWITTSTWLDKPSLKQTFSIKINNIGLQNVSLKFLIKNKYSGEVYETPTKTFVNEKLSNLYIENLNKTIQITKEKGSEEPPIVLNKRTYWEVYVGVGVLICISIIVVIVRKYFRNEKVPTIANSHDHHFFLFPNTRTKN